MLLLAGLAFALPAETHVQIHSRLMAAVDAPAKHGCLTPLVAELKQHWSEFTPAERAHATAVLAPSRVDLFTPNQLRTGPPPPPASDSCVGQQMNHRVVGTHFVVEWDAGITEATANTFLDALEHSYEVEVEDMGWLAPQGDGQYLLPAYVENQNTNGAYTYVQECHNEYMPYISTGKNSWQDPDWGDTMASHEFNHTLQFHYSFAPQLWWWEATATWIESYVYPSITEWSWYVQGYTENPQIAFSASDQQDQDIFYHMYGMALWAFYVDEYMGGQEKVREIWENSRRDHGTDDLTISDMMDELEVDWEAAFVDFTARNAVMDYNEHAILPAMKMVDTVDSFPAEGESSRSTKPQGYGENYVKFEKGFDDGTLTVNFTGDSNVDWSIQLVEATRSSVERSVVAHIEGGEGSVSMEDVGSNDVYLVMSPLKDKESEYSYSWSADVEASSNPDPDSGESQDTGRSNGGDVSDDGGEKISIGQACACASGSSPQWSFAAAALAGAVTMRRRRR